MVSLICFSLPRYRRFNILPCDLCCSVCRPFQYPFQLDYFPTKLTPHTFTTHCTDDPQLAVKSRARRTTILPGAVEDAQDLTQHMYNRRRSFG